MPFNERPYFKTEATQEAVIKYLERNPEIYYWNGDFVLKVQREVQRAKDFLLK